MRGELYYVVVICFFIADMILFQYDVYATISDAKLDKAYRALIGSVLVFYVQDIIWGILISHRLENTLPLFISSTIGHLGYSVISLVWLNYTLCYLGENIKYRKVYRKISLVALCIQVILLVVNFSYPIIFSIGENGEYICQPYRIVVFGIQYVFYLSSCILSIVSYFKSDKKTKKRYVAIILFVLAPVVCGWLQLAFPESPFYSCGYFLGCLIIHIYIVSDERNALIFKKLYIDENTVCWNKNAFAMDSGKLKENGMEDDFYIMITDVNGLKEINDQQGHVAGDELLAGVTTCLDKAFGRYGKVYRIGGDEFVALLNMSNSELESGKTCLCRELECWKGVYVKKLSISYGTASKQEFPNETFDFLFNIADNRMYMDKSNYYKNRNMTEKLLNGFWHSLSSLCSTILQVNLTLNTYRDLIGRDEVDEHSFTSGSLSQWLEDYMNSGYVHYDDLDTFRCEADIKGLVEYFRSGKREKHICFRQNQDGIYIPSILMIVPSEKYSHEFQNMYLYIKEVELE